MKRYRREFVSSVSAIGVLGIAGCSGDGSVSGAPDPDANPKDLLPEAPNGWSIETAANQQMAGMIGAEAGYQRSFDGPDGDHYAVEFYRFPSNSDAVDAKSTFDTWTVYVVRGNFGFAGNGPDVDNVYLLMGNSSALSEEYVRNNNLL